MDPIRFAIIGAGNIGKILAEAIAHVPQARVSVVCNRTEATGRPLAGRHNADWVADYQAAVGRDDVDVVAVCTPSGTHMEIAIAAAEAGKHLLVEKPLEITLSRVDRIIEAVDKAGVILACVFPRRFAVGVETTKAALEAGRLGTMTLADVYVKWHRDQAYYDADWRGTWALDGGGALMNQSIHQIDMLQWLAGPVESVFARAATLAHDMETEDTACAVLTFENGALGVIQGATSAWPGDQAKTEIRGSGGSIVLEDGRIALWKLAGAEPGEEARMLNLEAAQGSGASDPTAIGYEMHRRQVVDLVEAIAGKRPPKILGQEARKSVEIIRAMYHSAQTGRPVSLPFADDAW
jgi:predicted dehydrogenase